MSVASIAPELGYVDQFEVRPALRAVPAVEVVDHRWQRPLDVLGSLVLLLVLAPVLAGIALAIAATSPGGVVFRQTRVGRGGVPFTVLKFRTMLPDGDRLRAQLAAMDEGNGMLFKIRRDPRVTGVGRVLRRLSLDELPQLVNVLKGEMSLVGPRPALPEEVARYTEQERRRLSTRPGITGGR